MTNHPGILALWNDCAPDGEAEYERWYMAQHLPERIGVPGFRFGRRYRRIEGDRKYFSFYETDTPDVLWSERYLERLANPTDWTQRVMLDFQNTIRTVCRKAVSIGGALGGHAVTFRFMDDEVPSVACAADLEGGILAEILERDGICHAHLWIAAAEQTPAKTAETDLRGEDELVSSAVIVETTSVEAALALAHDVAVIERVAALQPGCAPTVGVYALMCILSPDMIQSGAAGG